MQRGIPVSLIRGGSSKAVFIQSKDLPEPGPLRDKVILRLFGSPDPRQIDGLGGADVLTSKLAIVGPPTTDGADVDYTFGQVSFATEHVDYKGNCGNISSAVGPFAIDEGIIPFDGNALTQLVRIHNTNTGAILKAVVCIGEHGAEVEGIVAIGGVPGFGSRVDLDFSATQGSVTGALLPTGHLVDTLEVHGTGSEAPERLEASLIDAGQATVFLRAADLGLAGSSSDIAACIRQSDTMLRRLERIRGAAAVAMGIVEKPQVRTQTKPKTLGNNRNSREVSQALPDSHRSVGSKQDAESLSPYTPFVVIVAAKPPPQSESDLNATCVFMQKLHQVPIA
eukprot:2531334-Amphidinium_carterae.1